MKQKIYIFIVSFIIIVATSFYMISLLSKDNTSQNNLKKDTATSITMPADMDNKRISGVFSFQPVLTAGSSIERVELYIDNELRHSSYDSPFELSFDSSELANGSYQVYVKVISEDGKESQSERVTIVVYNKDNEATSTSDENANNSPGTEDIIGTGASFYAPVTLGPKVSVKQTNSVKTPSKPPAKGPTTPTAPSIPTPTAVTGVSVSLVGGDVKIDWNENPSSPTIDSYLIYKNGIYLTSVNSPVATFTDTAVTPGYRYQYQIAAHSTAGKTAVLSTSVAITLPSAHLFSTPPPVESMQSENPSTGLNLGMRFTPKVDGTITGLRFYKFAGDVSTHKGTLWTNDGMALAAVDFTDESSSGWQTANFKAPVKVKAGTVYVISYFTENSTTIYYAGTPGGFSDNPISSTYLEAPVSTPEMPNGVFATADVAVFPDHTYGAANYWVDPTFRPHDPDYSVAFSHLDRIPWEGGPSYYQQFSKTDGSWTDPNFFPVGVWYESVLTQADIDKDKSYGLNTYFELTSQSNLSLVGSNGMNAVISDTEMGSGSETKGWLATDEPDMGWGAGNGPYDPETNKCMTEGVYDCGYTLMEYLLDLLPKDDGRLAYTNYGKGVLFWQNDQQASQFVNGYTTATSADLYFYTDLNLCVGDENGNEAENFIGIETSDCRRAASYGWVLDRMRYLDSLDGKRQPIYAFVENGHPFTYEASTAITADEMAGAVMSSLIHEARGIIYFNHNFGGDCISQHNFRDGCYPENTAKATEINAHIKQLAPVLNTQSYNYSFNPNLDTMLKKLGNSYYIFAMQGQGAANGSYDLKLPSGINASSAEVMFENRSVTITDGKITDSFPEEYSYHIYKITP